MLVHTKASLHICDPIKRNESDVSPEYLFLDIMRGSRWDSPPKIGKEKEKEKEKEGRERKEDKWVFVLVLFFASDAITPLVFSCILDPPLDTSLTFQGMFILVSDETARKV